jgi:hypothetical protein
MARKVLDAGGDSLALYLYDRLSYEDRYTGRIFAEAPRPDHGIERLRVDIGDRSQQDIQAEGAKDAGELAI